MSWEPETDSTFTAHTTEAAGAPAAVPSASTTRPFGDISLLHAHLAECCAAGLPLPRALRALAEDLQPKGGLRAQSEALAADLENGTPLAEAYARHDDTFPVTYRALVDAGIASGDVAGVLREISIDASLRAQVRDRLKRNLEYPLWTAGIVLAIAIATLIWLSMHGHPLPSSATGSFSHLHEVWTGPQRQALFALTPQRALLTIGALSLVAGACYFVLRRPLDPGSKLHGLRYRIPMFGRLCTLATKASFAATMALLVRRQIPLPRALRLCAEGTDQNAVREQILRMAKGADEGRSLGDSVRAGDLIPGNLLWFVEAASSATESARALDDIAGVYRQRLLRSADRISVYAVPVVQLLTGLVIASIAVYYLRPMTFVAEILR